MNEALQPYSVKSFCNIEECHDRFFVVIEVIDCGRDYPRDLLRGVVRRAARKPN